MRSLLLCASLAVVSITNAQAPAIEWTNCYGGTADDFGGSGAPTADGGMVLVAQTESNDGDVSGHHGGNYDMWVAKLDALGAVEWQKCLGGSSGDGGYTVRPTADGGYVVSGSTSSTDGDVSGHHGAGDGWVVKLDATGTLQWQHALGGSAYDHTPVVLPTSDGGYTLVGETESNDGEVSGNHGVRDAWVVKLDANGALLWQRCLGGSAHDEARGVIATTDGGYLVSGSTDSNDGDVTGNHGDRDVWVVKLDGLGAMQWQKALGGTGVDFGGRAVQTADGGYILGGRTTSTDGDVSANHGGRDVWIVKLDPVGTIEWEKSLGGTMDEGGRGTVKPWNGGYIVAASTESNDGDVSGNHFDGTSDAWIVKMDATGTIEWQKCVGSLEYDYTDDIHPLLGGGLLIMGLSDSYSGGEVVNNHGGNDVWVVTLEGFGMGVDRNTASEFTISPVPATSTLQVTSATVGSIHLHDALGREVLSRAMNGTAHALDVSELPRGVYTITLRTANGSQVQRLVLE